MLSPCAHQRLCRARDRLREVHDPPLTLERIAREAAMSEDHFIRRFARVFGETPHQYRTRARLEVARQRLVLGDGSVTEICMDLGFASLGSFSTLFSRHFGDPPSRYRRRFFPAIALPGRPPDAVAPLCATLMTAAWLHSGRFSRSG